MSATLPPAADITGLGPVGAPLPIVPDFGRNGWALSGVIAILAFLAALAAGAAAGLASSAAQWRASLAGEATIQIRPIAGRDMEADLARVVALAQGAPGIRGAAPVSSDDARALLEPWIGQGLDLSTLPVPRLVVLHLGETAREDLPRLGLRLKIEVPGATIDDHSAWLERLGSLTTGLTAFALMVAVLVLLASAGAVAFAVEGVVATHREVVEVLHFVGARDSYLQGIFSRRFARHGLIGAVLGSVAAGAIVLGILIYGQGGWGRPSSGSLASLTPAMAVVLAILSVVGATWIVAGWAAGGTVKRFLNADR